MQKEEIGALKERVDSLYSENMILREKILNTYAELYAILRSKPWRFYTFLGSIKRKIVGLFRSSSTKLNANYNRNEATLEVLKEKSINAQGRDLKRFYSQLESK